LKLSRELGKHNGEAPQQKEEAHFKIKVLKTENHETWDYGCHYLYTV